MILTQERNWIVNHEEALPYNVRDTICMASLYGRSFPVNSARRFILFTPGSHTVICVLCWDGTDTHTPSTRTDPIHTIHTHVYVDHTHLTITSSPPHCQPLSHCSNRQSLWEIAHCEGWSHRKTQWATATFRTQERPHPIMARSRQPIQGLLAETGLLCANVSGLAGKAVRCWFGFAAKKYTLLCRHRTVQTGQVVGFLAGGRRHRGVGWEQSLWHGQTGPNGAKQGQTGPNRSYTPWCLTILNWTVAPSTSMPLTSSNVKLYNCITSMYGWPGCKTVTTDGGVPGDGRRGPFSDERRWVTLCTRDPRPIACAHLAVFFAKFW